MRGFLIWFVIGGVVLLFGLTIVIGNDAQPTNFGNAILCKFGDKKSSFCLDPGFATRVKKEFHPEWKLDNLTKPECFIFYNLNDTEVPLFPNGADPPKGTPVPEPSSYGCTCRIFGSYEREPKNRVNFKLNFINDEMDGNNIYGFFRDP